MILTEEQVAELEKSSPPVKYSDVGERIHTARKAKRITQFELAEKLGIDYSEMSDIEHGRELPTKEQLMKIAAITDFDIARVQIRNFLR